MSPRIYAPGGFVLAPEFQRLGKHIAASEGFVSKIVLWAESGYFDTEAELKPMLHLWSLGVEEQFLTGMSRFREPGLVLAT